MINFAHEHARQILKTARSVVLATTGNTGVQASEFPCEAVDLDLYLLLPKTSDHLFNLERDSRVALHADQWELTGNAEALADRKIWPRIDLVRKTESAWYVMVKVVPSRVQILRPEGWGPAETIDLS